MLRTTPLHLRKNICIFFEISLMAITLHLPPNQNVATGTFCLIGKSSNAILTNRDVKYNSRTVLLVSFVYPFTYLEGGAWHKTVIQVYRTYLLKIKGRKNEGKKAVPFGLVIKTNYKLIGTLSTRQIVIGGRPRVAKT